MVASTLGRLYPPWATRQKFAALGPSVARSPRKRCCGASGCSSRSISSGERLQQQIDGLQERLRMAPSPRLAARLFEDGRPRGVRVHAHLRASRGAE